MDLEREVLVVDGWRRRAAADARMVALMTAFRIELEAEREFIHLNERDWRLQSDVME